MLGVSVGHQSPGGDLPVREHFQGRVGDYLERSDVVGVRRHWGWWEVSKLSDLNSLVINNSPVMIENVLNSL